MVAQTANAIIMAGTSVPNKLIDEDDGLGPKNKAFLHVNNQPVILNVLSALQGSKYINQDKITIVGPKSDLEKIITPNKRINIIQESGEFTNNVISACDHPLNYKKRKFILSCELPFIASKTIDDFVEQCNQYQANLYFSMINTKNIPKQIEPFKKSKKFHLKERGYYRTANMSLLDDDGIEDRKSIEDQVRAVFECRRAVSWGSMAKLVYTLGKFSPQAIKYFAPTSLRHVRGLTEDEVESAILKKLNLRLKSIETTDPRAVADIDYKADLVFFNKNYERIKNVLDNYSKNIS